MPTPVAAGSYVLGEQPSGEAWQNGLKITGLVDRHGRLVSRQGSFTLLRTADALHFRIETELPPKGELLARVHPGRGNSNAVALDDTVEIWLSPMTEAKEPPVYQLMTNALGALYALRHSKTATVAVADWQPGASVTHAQENGRWIATVRIPLASLQVDPARLPGVLFRIVRNWRQPVQTSASEAFAEGGGFSNRETMSRLRFVSGAPVIALERILGEGRRGLDLRLALHAAPPRVLEVAASLESTTNVAPRVSNETFDFAKTGTQRFLMEKRLESDTVFHAKLSVRPPDGSVALFERTFSLDTGPAADGWAVLQPGEASRYQFAYLPYHRRLLLQTTERPAGPVGVALSKGEEAALVSSTLAPEAWVAISRSGQTGWVAEVALPELATGSYTVALSSPALKEPERHPLEVERFEWEKNAIGTEPVPPPPFTPVRAEGEKIALLLREYTLNGAGFWRTVTAEGRPLLAAPVGMSATLDGREVSELESVEQHLERQNGVESSHFSRWKLGGALEGETRTTVAFDGLVTTTITLPAQPGVTVQRLSLRLPVADGEVRYLHQVGAGIRGNYAGAVPKGKGRVWSNLDAMSYGYPDRFIPYLWVGGIRRGIAVMADSANGWAIGEGEPSLTLEREGEALVVGLHLISRPVGLEQPRTVTLCWQATPVKEKPQAWRRYSMGGPFPGAEAVTIHGSGLYWGALSSFGDVYPRGRDFRYLEAIAREREAGADVSASFIETWNQGYEGLPREDRYREHVRTGFRNAQQARFLIPYTNARGARETMPEFLAFQDEWVRQGFTARRWSDDHFGEIKTDPAGSFQDFALWYFRKMKEVGYAAGIYFDNAYLVASHNPWSVYQAARAYGPEARPSVGLDDLRDYFLRTYRLFSGPDGQRPLNIFHMTNAAIVPHLSFATLQLDWEMKYGSEDFQDRFDEDYIFASSLGEQSGTIPVVLSGIHPSAAKSAEWLTRTLFATTAVYELKVWPTFKIDKPSWQRWQEILYAFGYGAPETKVYRFWEEPPFALNRPDARALVMERDGKFLCVLSDFGNGGETTLSLDARLLGESTRFKATDAETGKAVRFGGGKVTLPLARHDFCLLLIEPETAP